MKATISALKGGVVMLTLETENELELSLLRVYRAQTSEPASPLSTFWYDGEPTRIQIMSRTLYEASLAPAPAEEP
jgi:hypothetical protein